MPTSLSGDQIILDLKSRTYEDFRAQSIQLIPVLTPEWTDIFPHDPGVVLLELFSGQSDVLSYYLDKAVAESHWGTARIRQSILNMVDLIGYTPKSAVSATVPVTVTTTGAGGTLNGVNTAGVVPFRIATSSSSSVGVTYWELLEEKTFAVAELSDELVFVEGRTILNEILGSSDASAGQTFTLAQSPLTAQADGTFSAIIQVFNGATWVTWSVAPTDNFVESLSTDYHYTIDVDQEGIATIRFGDGVNGAIPERGISNVRCTYRIGGGKTANNVEKNSITSIITSGTIVNTVTNTAKPSGGDNRESIDEIKNNAPKVWATQNRAVTHADFEAFATAVNGVFKAKAEWYNGSPVREAVYIAVTGDNPVPTGSWDINKQSGTGLLGNVGKILVDKAASAVVIVMLPVTALDIKVDVEIIVLNNYLQSDVLSLTKQAIKDYVRDEDSGVIPDLLPLSGLMSVLENIDGVDYVNVRTFRREPYVQEESVGYADTTFSSVTVGDVTLDETWTIRFSSSTEFTVEGTASGPQAGGTVGSLYTSDSGEIQFTATAGAQPNQIGDTYKIVTGEEVGNISIQTKEIPVLLDANLSITTTGGIPQ